MTIVRLDRVELKHGCEVLMNGRASREWVASKHGVAMYLDMDRRLLCLHGDDRVPMYVPVENAKCWVEAVRSGEDDLADALVAKAKEMGVSAAELLVNAGDMTFGSIDEAQSPPPAPARKRKGKA